MIVLVTISSIVFVVWNRMLIYVSKTWIDPFISELVREVRTSHSLWEREEWKERRDLRATQLEYWIVELVRDSSSFSRSFLKTSKSLEAACSIGVMPRTIGTEGFDSFFRNINYRTEFGCAWRKMSPNFCSLFRVPSGTNAWDWQRSSGSKSTGLEVSHGTKVSSCEHNDFHDVWKKNTFILVRQNRGGVKNISGTFSARQKSRTFAAYCTNHDDIDTYQEAS